MASLLCGVVDNGNKFEVVIKKAKELLEASVTSEQWTKMLDKRNGVFGENHPKVIAY